MREGRRQFSPAFLFSQPHCGQFALEQVNLTYSVNGTRQAAARELIIVG